MRRLIKYPIQKCLSIVGGAAVLNFTWNQFSKERMNKNSNSILQCTKPILIPVSYCETKDGMRLVKLKPRKYNSDSSDFSALWLWWKMYYDTNELIIRTMAATMEEFKLNPQKYPHCAQCMRDDQLSLFKNGMSNIERLSEAMDQHRKQYKELVKPFTEFTWSETIDIVRQGSVWISDDEPWNQDKADELIDQLDMLQLTACREIAELRIAQFFSSSPNIAEIEIEVKDAVNVAMKKISSK